MASAGGRGMVGGWSPTSADDKSVQDNSLFAAKHINMRSNALNHKRLVNVHAAEVQVVAGIKYKLVFDIGATTVRKNTGDEADAANAELNKEMPIERCTAVVWERSWLNEREVLEFKCERYMSHDEYFSSENQAREKASRSTSQVNSA